MGTFAPAEIDNILVVKMSSIGDVVHTLPAVARLRESLPDSRITWVVERSAGAILKDCPAIDHLLEIDTRQWRTDLSSAATRKAIRSALSSIRGNGRIRQWDAAIDFQGLMKSGLVAYLSRATRRIGFESGDLREPASKLFLTDQVRTQHLPHVVDKNIALAAALVDRDSDPRPYQFPIAVSIEDESRVNEIIETAGGPFAILNPGGGWPTKLWDACSYGLIADWLFDEYGFLSMATFGPGEEELARRVIAASRSGAARPVECTLKQFVALARSARLFVGGDTGPLHLAASVGTPIVGIYGPTSPERNGPFDTDDVTVGLDLWCRSDCHRRSCWHWQCLDIPVEEVKHAVSLRLSRVANARAVVGSRGRVAAGRGAIDG